LKYKSDNLKQSRACVDNHISEWNEICFEDKSYSGIGLILI
jgi:hypothetical protein